MKKVSLLIAIFVLSLAHALCVAAPPKEITFAVPDSGRVTLGIFDGTGKLVRILHRLAPEKDFRVGLNGYTTQWDGLDDARQPLPAGHYYMRGYLVGNTPVSGEEFHFNDWAAGNSGLAIQKILDFCLIENGGVLLLAKSDKKILLARYSPEHGFLWNREIDGTLLAANSDAAALLDNSSCSTFSLEAGTPLSSQTIAAVTPTALAMNEDSVLIAAEGKLIALSFLKLESKPAEDLPFPFTSIDADATRLIGCSKEGVWIQKKDASFQKIPLPAEIASVTLGAGETFWFVGNEPGSSERLVGQVSFSGEILRLLRPEPGAPLPDKIRASHKSDQFAVLESRPGLQRLRVMARESKGGWTIEWERTIEDFARFGFVDNRPVADVGDASQAKELKFRLKKNPLTGRHDTLDLHAIFDKDGTHLVTTDGLPIADVSTQSDINRIAIQRGQTSDSMRMLQGNGIVVEEFSIRGLKNILPLDVGGVDLE